jgi:hypothetical protein
MFLLAVIFISNYSSDYREKEIFGDLKMVGSVVRLEKKFSGLYIAVRKTKEKAILKWL